MMMIMMTMCSEAFNISSQKALKPSR